MAAAESWLWLADLDQIVPDKAIDPMDEYDTRESIPELLTKHASNIELVKEAIKEEPNYVPSKHDNVWIVRFLLSQKKVKKAVKAAKHALEFRKEHGLDEKDLRFISPNSVHQSGEDTPFAGCDSLERSWNLRYPGDCMVFTIPDKNRGVAGFLRLADIQNDPETLKALTDEDLGAVFIYLSEWTFQWSDYVTRKTGRLTKSVRFIDFTGFSFFGASREATKRDGKIMEKMDDVYPQLLQTLFFLQHRPLDSHTLRYHASLFAQACGGEGGYRGTQGEREGVSTTSSISIQGELASRIGRGQH